MTVMPIRVITVFIKQTNIYKLSLPVYIDFRDHNLYTCHTFHPYRDTKIN